MPRVVKKTNSSKVAKSPIQVKSKSTGPDPSLSLSLTPKSPSTAKLAKPSEVPAPRKLKAGSKQAQVIALLHKPQGVSLTELMHATSWQAHSVRGFLSGTIKKKLNLNLISQKINGAQVYRIGADD
ncbi:DUF3489 domain-containing protein [Polynucleobacter sp. AP-Nino-20-G2]|uniref:DUF3489 domain-containing protein n=1 Tax=Polynucleobacter sp. AP-Nino-20-G2 TaxID=2576917 RepID=UPI001BFE6EE0|nr:DUF3489 domain-containing protein [Polynucleobacter sp. AP-Nino-20-G2]QWE17155.1 DUF3489 domain-containing protein [Polynucleobacter sp. AP-Nino-20-G2]